jgi:cytochrome bd-type quinol oxidase subunit 1
MQISARVAAFFSFVFAAVCMAFAIDAFTSLADIADPEQASGGRDFAWIWTFLAVVGAVIGWVSWRVGRTPMDEDA